MKTRIGVTCTQGVGAQRGGRDRNEDNFLICAEGRVSFLGGGEVVDRESLGAGAVVAVCDGMGGHDDGHVASETAVRVLAKLHQVGVPRDPAKALARYVQDAHQRLYWKARDAGPVTMGTTLSAVWLVAGGASWVQVGDSRIYHLRDGVLRQLSLDQTQGEFARRDGRESVGQSDALAQSFLYGSRGQGDDSRLRIERGRDSGTEPLDVGDQLLLCSDGVSGTLDTPTIAALLNATSDPQQGADALVQAAMAAGSTDNVTALVVWVDELEAVSSDDDYWDQDDESTLMV